MDELKPCPFCGREARLLVAIEEGICVRCVECGAQTPWLNDAPLGVITEWKKCIKETSSEHAVKLWNRRANHG